MAVIQRGLGVVWGVSSTGMKYDGAAQVIAWEPTGQTLRKSSTVEEILDKQGSTVTTVWINPIKELALRVYPKTKAANVLPDAGDIFEITDADDPEIAGTKWLVLDASKTKENTANVQFEVSLKLWEADMSVTPAP